MYAYLYGHFYSSLSAFAELLRVIIIIINTVLRFSSNHKCVSMCLWSSSSFFSLFLYKYSLLSLGDDDDRNSRREKHHQQSKHDVERRWHTPSRFSARYLLIPTKFTNSHTCGGGGPDDDDDDHGGREDDRQQQWAMQPTRKKPIHTRSPVKGFVVDYYFPFRSLDYAGAGGSSFRLLSTISARSSLFFFSFAPNWWLTAYFYGLHLLHNANYIIIYM